MGGRDGRGRLILAYDLFLTNIYKQSSPAVLLEFSPA